jgi:hypothetical protein
MTAAVVLVGVGAAGTGQTSRIVLTGTGKGTVTWKPELADEPLACPPHCETLSSLEGMHVTASAAAQAGSRFVRWGGRCEPAGANRSCSFTGVAGPNVVEARFDSTSSTPPPKRRTGESRVPFRGTTTLQISASTFDRLRRHGYTLQAIAPARLVGRALTLPIAATGPLSIYRSTSRMVVSRLGDGRCMAEFPTSATIHHAGGLRLSRPGGRLATIPLQKPVFSFKTGSPVLMFQDARDLSVAKSGKLSKARPGLVAPVVNDIFLPGVVVREPTVRFRGLRTKLDADSWVGLVEGSSVPTVTTGTFATADFTVRVPATAC